MSRPEPGRRTQRLVAHLSAFAAASTRDAILRRLVEAIVDTTQARGAVATVFRRAGADAMFAAGAEPDGGAVLDLAVSLGSRDAQLRVEAGNGFNRDDELSVRLIVEHAESALLRLREREARRRERERVRRVQEKTEQRLARVHKVDRAGFELARNLTHDVPRKIVEIAAGLVGAECVLLVASTDEEQLEILASIGCNDDDYPRPRHVSASDVPPVLARTLRTRSVIVTSGGFSPLGADRADETSICVPLIADDRVIGALGASVPLSNDFARDGGELLAGFAEAAGRILDRAQRARLAEQGMRLRALTGRLVDAATSREVSDAIVEEGIAALDAASGTIAFISPSGDQLEITASRGHMPENVQRQTSLPLDAPYPIADAARELRDVILESNEIVLANYPALALDSPYQSSAAAALPLAIGGRSLGSIGFTFSTSRTFDLQDREFMRALARLCSQAVDRVQRARLHDRTARLQAVTAALARASTALEVAAVVATEGAQALGARGASVGVLSRDSERLHILANVGVPPGVADDWSHFRTNALIPMARAAATSEAVLLASPAEIEAAFPLVAEGFQLLGDRAVAGLPLLLGDAVLGAIQLTFAEPRDFTQDAAFLSTLANLCAEALERARLSDAIRASNEDRHRLLNRLEDGVIALTPKLTVDYANAKALELVALPRPAAGAQLPDVWPSCSLRELAAKLLPPHAEGTEHRVETPTGQILDVIGIPDEEKPVIVIRDVTRQERQERAEREFVANAAHELRTPLAAIAAAVDAIAITHDNVRRDYFLDGIATQTRRMTKLVHALLALARVQAAPEAALPPEPVQMLPLLRSIADELEVQPGVRVNVECAADIAALGDRSLIDATLRNLAENASRHTERGSIGLVAKEKNGHVIVEVRDTGGGISKEAQAHVFDRFYRADAEVGRGFGLGLPLAREIVRALGGEIAIESRLGTGTTLRVTFKAGA